MPALGELLDELLAERREIVRALLETRPSSTQTSSSTQFPPAFSMSVRRLGNEVSVRPRTASASTSVHGPWQMTPTGLPSLTRPGPPE